LYERVMVFTFQNRLQLYVFLSPYFIYFSWVECEIPGALKYNDGVIFLGFPGLVAKITFGRESDGFHISNPFTTCTYFSSHDFIFSSWVGMANTGGLKYRDGVRFYGFPWFSCKTNVCTKGSWFSHFESIYNLYVFLFTLPYIFSWVGMANSGGH